MVRTVLVSVLKSLGWMKRSEHPEHPGLGASGNEHHKCTPVVQTGGSVSGYHELMTSLTAQRSPAPVRRTGSRAVFLYIADRVENSLFCRAAHVSTHARSLRLAWHHRGK